MAERDDYIDAMIDALGPEGIEYFATAEGLKLETLRVGFNAYVREQSGVDTKEHGEVFDAFIEKVYEVYLTMRVH